MSFYGAILGTIISASITVFSFIENMKRNDKNNRITREQLNEQMRLSVLPVIDLHFILCSKPILDFDLSDIEWCFSFNSISGFTLQRSSLLNLTKAFIEEHSISQWCFYLEVTNIGMAPALNTTLYYKDFNVLLGSLSANGHRKYIYAIPKPENVGTTETYELSIAFSDAYGNDYSEIQKVDVSQSKFALYPINNPILVKKASIPS